MLPLSDLGTAPQNSKYNTLGDIAAQGYLFAHLMLEGVDADQQSQLNIHRHAIEALEKGLFQSTLKATNDNQTKAAVALGINRATLRTKLKRYNLI